MQIRDMKQKSVSTHDFSMIPRAEIPRSSFRMEKTVKTTFNFSHLVPILVEEVLPGDHWNARVTTVARTAVPIVPIMDNWHLDIFSFFVPCRLLWTNWVKFMGEQNSPGDSISFTIPQTTSPASGYAIGSLQDQMGLPTVGQVLGVNTVSHSALPLRAYNQIYNQWFRDENLMVPRPNNTGDGPDAAADYIMTRRGKRHDYFTSALPWPQKGNTAVSIPLGTSAPVRTSVADQVTGVQQPIKYYQGTTGTVPPNNRVAFSAGQIGSTATAEAVTGNPVYPANLYADLTTATAATINQLRQSFQIQKLLERDARGGTRYTEIVRSHFGVVSPDARLQRPEYIGGGHVQIITNAIPQTSATGLTGGTTPAGTLAATGHAQGSAGFTYAATEHGYILTLVSARTDINYMQGLRKLWSRSTRYDFYFPVFAMLGEQTVLNKEIYCDGTVNDNAVFGYQERWAEYRYNPSELKCLFRANAAGNIAYWHSAQLFTALPTLNETFITDNSDAVLARNFAAGAAVYQQLIADFFWTFTIARPLPMYSVPVMIDHF